MLVRLQSSWLGCYNINPEARERIRNKNIANGYGYSANVHIHLPALHTHTPQAELSSLVPRLRYYMGAGQPDEKMLVT